MVNVAVVGLGKMGLLHGAVLGALRDVRVVAYCEQKRVVRRFARGALPGAKIVGDVSELAGLDVNAVYVATLPGSHHAVVREVYQRDIARHVFVEKSLAASHAQAQEMCRLAAERGGVCMVGFQKRFGPTFAMTKRLLEEGALGTVSAFEAYAFSSDFADIDDCDGQAVSRGGVLRDQGSHPIDLAHWYWGDIEVVGVDTAAPGDDRPSDFTRARVTAGDGLTGTFSVSAQMTEYRLPTTGMRIAGSAGSIDVNDDRLVLTTSGRNETWHRQDLDDSRVPFLLGDAEYTRQDAAFVAAVAGGGGHGGADFGAGARVERVIDAIQGL